jgi:hypothetical protein
MILEKCKDAIYRISYLRVLHCIKTGKLTKITKEENNINFVASSGCANAINQFREIYHTERILK